jgi:predicted secreted protein
MSELQLDWTDRGQTFEVGVGDLVRVSLWENGTTGFYWSPVTVHDDPLEEVDGGHIGPSISAEVEQPPVLGSSSLREMTFRGCRPGTRDLVIRYWRGVEAPEDVIYQVTVKVRDDRSSPVDAQAGGSS